MGPSISQILLATGGSWSRLALCSGCWFSSGDALLDGLGDGVKSSGQELLDAVDGSLGQMADSQGAGSPVSPET